MGAVPIRPSPPAPEAVEDDSKRPESSFNTHTTQAWSSFSGPSFGGSGPSFQSLPSTTGSNPRSDGDSDIGSMSLFSASSKRSGAGGFSKLSELSDEEGFEEDFEEDVEEDSEQSRPARGARAGGDRPAPLSAAGAAAPDPSARCVLGCLLQVSCSSPSQDTTPAVEPEPPSTSHLASPQLTFGSISSFSRHVFFPSGEALAVKTKHSW